MQAIEASQYNKVMLGLLWLINVLKMPNISFFCYYSLNQ